MHPTIQTPDTSTPPKFLEKFFIQDKSLLGNDESFPDSVIMIHVQDGQYAAANLTTNPPDPMTVNFLLCFATEEKANEWKQAFFSGHNTENQTKEFQEARDIAVKKPNISGLLLWQSETEQRLHWVR